MAAVAKFEKCEGCGECVETCPSGAIEVKARKGCRRYGALRRLRRMR